MQAILLTRNVFARLPHRASKKVLVLKRHSPAIAVVDPLATLSNKGFSVGNISSPSSQNTG